MTLKRSYQEGMPNGQTAAAKRLPCAQRVPWDTQITWSVRLFYLVLIVITSLHRELLQTWVNQLWDYLLTSWIFNCVYFETWWTIFSYAVVFPVPWLMTKFRCFDKYKIEPDMKWHSRGLFLYLTDVVTYIIPLMILDSFLVKKYHGVDSSEWEVRRQNWIQYTRALPQDPPSLFGIIGCLVGTLLIYDFVFFLIHFSLHKNAWLYKHVHANHHNHPHFQAQVTNQLSLSERITLILSANEALKILNSHPLTRAIFVPFFLGWLIENHSGFNVPWTLDKVIPFGLVAGSSAHFRHHNSGSGNYQPFFTYIDRFILTPRTKEAKS